MAKYDSSQVNPHAYGNNPLTIGKNTWMFSISCQFSRNVFAHAEFFANLILKAIVGDGNWEMQLKWTFKTEIFTWK